MTKDRCPWFDGASLFETLDALEPQDRNKDAPFRMPVLDKHRDMGTIIMGKTEVRVGVCGLIEQEAVGDPCVCCH